MRASVLMLFLAGPCAAASIILTNFQSTATVTMPGSGNFAGWDFTERVGGTSPRDDPRNPLQVYLQVGAPSSLQVGAAPQLIDATASVDYSAPGYYVSAVLLFGYAIDSGAAGESMSISEPCSASVVGNYMPSQKWCVMHAVSGELIATLNMHTGIGDSGFSNAGPLMITLQLAPIENLPEPQLMALVGIVLMAISRLSRCSAVNLHMAGTTKQ